ncbi:MAG: AMP-binding protein [Actinomycetes bacterium]
MLSKPSASYSSATSDTPLLGRTIGEDFERTVAMFGDREALVDCATQRRWTYSELDVEVDELALGLLDRGLQAGDRVGIWSPNCAEWVLVQYATAKIGVILVNVNPAYRTHELTYVVRQSGMRLLFSAVRHKTSDYRRMVEQALPECPDLTR